MSLFDWIDSSNHTLDEIVTSLKNLRVSLETDEYSLQNKIKQQLDQNHIAYKKEYKLGTRCRLDFLIHGGIAIEVKRGLNKPNRTNVLNQLERYAGYEEVKAIILVVDRNMDLPSEINGKPCVVFGLHKLWGIAL